MTKLIVAFSTFSNKPKIVYLFPWALRGPAKKGHSLISNCVIFSSHFGITMRHFVTHHSCTSCFRKFKALGRVRIYTGNLPCNSTRPKMQSLPSQWTRNTAPPIGKCAKFKTEKRWSPSLSGYRGSCKVYSEILCLVVVVEWMEGISLIRFQVATRETVTVLSWTSTELRRHGRLTKHNPHSTLLCSAVKCVFWVE
jgi:hypothetical protein